MDDGKEQYAYQTTVKIGGHVFKGILHDQGPDKMMCCYSKLGLNTVDNYASRHLFAICFYFDIVKLYLNLQP
ncbi:unnamed protein product [Arabis nemorensis]|uniref:Uncharacterized protein n=1 Tax=Arabis nemorensis TaxID=586526 RepID=A0A565C4D0_9BRAS|nr:unnamed protein product [Arabis nemorensis]